MAEGAVEVTFLLGQGGRMLKHFRRPRNGKLRRRARLTASTVGYGKPSDGDASLRLWPISMAV